MSKKKQTPKKGILNMIEKNLTERINSNHSLNDILKITDHRVDYLWNKVETPTNNPRMLLREEKRLMRYHQVYVHKDIDDNIVYVGSGIFGRDDDALARRQSDHSRWMLEMIGKGIDFCKTVSTGLDFNECRKLEKEIKDNHKPRFNLQ